MRELNTEELAFVSGGHVNGQQGEPWIVWDETEEANSGWQGLVNMYVDAVMTFFYGSGWDSSANEDFGSINVDSLQTAIGVACEGLEEGDSFTVSMTEATIEIGPIFSEGAQSIQITGGCPAP